VESFIKTRERKRKRKRKRKKERKKERKKGNRREEKTIHFPVARCLRYSSITLVPLLIILSRDSIRCTFPVICKTESPSRHQKFGGNSRSEFRDKFKI
jgi:hypothetical protein